MQRRDKFSRHEKNRLGAKIREARLSRGLTYDQLANRMGAEFVTASEIERWEHCGDIESNLGVIHLREIAKALRVDPGALLA
jgi:transcriptional regulator with XRE-family HTH domain